MKGAVPVLLLVRELDLGGIERDVSKFARHLGVHGIEPHVGCFRPGGMRWREIEAAGIPLLPLPMKSFKSRAAISAALTLYRYIRQHGIEVIHAFEPSTAVFGLPVALLARTRVRLTGQLCFRDLNPPGLRKLQPLIDRLSSGLFVNCQAVARHLTADFGISAERVFVCHNGFEPGEFHARRRMLEGGAESSVTIGTVAVLREEKNIGLLIDAFAAVRQADPRPLLIIVGEGPERESLKRKVAEQGLAACVRFEPATAAPADWMRAMDVFVLPSRSESFSNALLEAMACGCCPVASNVGGTPELIEHGVRGLLFESGSVTSLSETLLEIVRDGPRRNAMALEAARFAHTNLTMDIAAARLASIYRELLASRRSQLF